MPEEESRHLITVLRRQPGDHLRLTDGKGSFYDGELAEAGKKLALVKILRQENTPISFRPQFHLAIAPTKQIDRIEWMLEKATEIGLGTLSLLHCKRSERSTVRIDRLEKIALSAMKQSLRPWLPDIRPLVKFDVFVKQIHEKQRYIAWCPETPPPHLATLLIPAEEVVVLIGPEGDFTPEEVNLAEEFGFQPVNLGPARLRTETAGLVAVCVASATSSK